ncbi:hypothetical protein J415_06555 [Klebsiella michiganensis HKOPL1]|uniref:Uncharacterized protein n=1 Tax=Klebsiella michiganensis (strain ATCC 8724 / DSM 4798 / JCM 20051 / NBRC 3318 / NRRL B-199 / KCTC 1686 / BUCSAV 143 / CCM 1901) TaxID=1006551 RepID=A0A0H3GYQ3_KLEM8|nr:hypothetical protein KOX_03210 [Klebsiella michiganensis KCTC 1686]AHW86860.1 hypothetical protein J415_06555 [Klebsiella michiganensis HKOPL1]
MTKEALPASAASATVLAVFAMFPVASAWATAFFVMVSHVLLL